jgi:4-amino-4-deoxy-L-arabinose transferase-like glycosyltransferase
MTMPGEKHWLWVVVATFLVLNAVIWGSIDETVRLKQAGDGDSWYKPSVGLYLHGKFVYPDSPDQETLYRPPVFPLFAAGMFTLAGAPSPNAIAFGQIVLLLLTGLIFRNIVNDWLPGWGALGMALLCLNPNVFTIAQYTQSDTLFLFLMTSAIWAILKYARDSSGVRYALLAGIALAMATLTRPTAQFLILVLPIALPLIEIVNGNVANWFRALLKGIVAAMLGGMILFPWAHHVKSIEGAYDLSSAEVKARYIWDQIAILEAQHSGLSYHESEKTQSAQYDALAARYGAAWQSMSEVERYKAQLQEGYSVLLSYPTQALITAYGRSILQFFTAGGSGRWHSLHLEDPEFLAETWFKSKQSDVSGMLKRAFGSASPSAKIISAVCLVFVIVARLVGLIGLIAITPRRYWSLLMVLCAVIAYFALVHLFVGNSRYRISIEPALMLLFIFGIESVWQRWRGREVDGDASPS